MALVRPICDAGTICVIVAVNVTHWSARQNALIASSVYSTGSESCSL